MHTTLNLNGTWALVLAVAAGTGGPAYAAEPVPAAALGNPEQRWSTDGPGGVPEFQRHIQPLLGKLGCNNRACHGSFRGQNGFRLSLFGSDPAADHKALVLEDKGDGPRLNLKAPEKSLALLKPTAEVKHGGGQRFEVGSWQHRMFIEWVRAGAPFDPKKESRVEQFLIEPARLVLGKPEAKLPLRLIASYSDGSRDDVTGMTTFASRDDAVAKVSEEGEVSAARPGGTAIVASYGPVVTTCQVLVPRPDDDAAFPEFASSNPIDALVGEQLKALNIRPSELASDEMFLRRVYLDLVGTLPTSDEARQFLGDRRPDKRSLLIDQLLARPEYAMYWATYFSDLTGNSGVNPHAQVSEMWQNWLQVRLERNMPYDELVDAIVTATSLEGRSRDEYLAEIAEARKNFGALPSYNIRTDLGRATTGKFDQDVYSRRKTLDLYWLRIPNRNSERIALQTASAFLGIRLDCAQCHKHPFDRWTQQDFQQFQSFFRVVEYVAAKDGGTVPRPSAIHYGRDEVRVALTQRNNPAVQRYPPKLLGGRVISFKEGDPDPRIALAEWMRSPDNPYFARSLTNRIWAHYFGVGIVEPIEDFSNGNPPSNPRLLDWLARDFIENKFDLKHLHRRILNSRTYQLSWEPNDSNRLDKQNFSHAQFRRMPAEVLLHAIGTATGVPYRFNEYYPKGTPPIGYAPTAFMPFVLDLFGRGRRVEACGGCDRTQDLFLNQALYLLNDVEIAERVDIGKGRLAQLKTVADDRRVIEELYLAALSRFPTRSEMEAALAYRKKCESRDAWLEDLLWSLLNVREFVFVH